MRSKPDDDAGPLPGYEVLVAVCGGIAAYKVGHVVSQLVQRGAGVTVAMTSAARKFVGPTTFRALTGRRVLTSIWTEADPSDVQHIALSGAADLMLIAPATANIIGKIAAGIADDIVTTLVVSQDSPVLLAPAMNTRMWQNRVVQRNLATLKELGCEIIDPGEGWLACRTVGPGRMAEPEEILEAVATRLTTKPPKAQTTGTTARRHGGAK